jgi:hypothetical protein
MTKHTAIIQKEKRGKKRAIAILHVTQQGKSVKSRHVIIAGCKMHEFSGTYSQLQIKNK